MRITLYQANASMLKEMQMTIHQKNLQELQRLNHQEEPRKPKVEPANIWVKPNSVDVMV